jgi:hypothetical protein
MYWNLQIKHFILTSVMSILNFRVFNRRFNVLRTIESHGFDIETCRALSIVIVCFT